MLPLRDDWSLDLERDLYAVAAEVGMSPNEATALVAAARKGHIASNPGVLLSQVGMRRGLTTLGGMPQRRADHWHVCRAACEYGWQAGAIAGS